MFARKDNRKVVVEEKEEEVEEEEEEEELEEEEDEEIISPTQLVNLIVEVEKELKEKEASLSLYVMNQDYEGAAGAKSECEDLKHNLMVYSQRLKDLRLKDFCEDEYSGAALGMKSINAYTEIVVQNALIHWDVAVAATKSLIMKNLKVAAETGVDLVAFRINKNCGFQAFFDNGNIICPDIIWVDKARRRLNAAISVHETMCTPTIGSKWPRTSQFNPIKILNEFSGSEVNLRCSEQSLLKSNGAPLVTGSTKAAKPSNINDMVLLEIACKKSIFQIPSPLHAPVTLEQAKECISLEITSLKKKLKLISAMNITPEVLEHAERVFMDDDARALLLYELVSLDFKVGFVTNTTGFGDTPAAVDKEWGKAWVVSLWGYQSSDESYRADLIRAVRRPQTLRYMPDGAVVTDKESSLDLKSIVWRPRRPGARHPSTDNGTDIQSVITGQT